MKIFVSVAVLVSIVSLSLASNLPAENGKLGIFFKYEVDPAKFASGSNPLVQFQASEVNNPDLPTWLRFEQNDRDDRAFLYGTPVNENATTVKLQITGWNKKDYSTTQKFLIIDIDTSESPPRYQADFKIVNKKIDKFLADDDEDEFLSRVDELKWTNAVVTKVDSAPDRGGRYPLPGDVHKEGVYIRVGSPGEYQILEGATNCRGLQNNPFLDKPKFNVDWCELTLIDMTKVESSPDTQSTGNTSTGFITAMSFEPVEYDDSRRDLVVPFVLVVIIPLLIGIILFILLSFVMFGRREGVAVRDGNTPNEQILHHHSIRRATFRLREMSKPQPVTETDGNPTPPPPRSHGPPPSESGSEAGESDRSAPPPYRMPPTFPAGSPGNTRQQPPPFMRSGSMS